MSTPADLERLQARVNDTLADGLLDSLGGPSAAVQSPDVQRLQPDQDAAPFDVAMNPAERALVRGGMAATGADKRLDATLGRMTGGALNPADIHALEDRALRTATWDEGKALTGIQEGPPVTLTPQQKAIIDRLMRQSGSDALGQSAQKAYQKAWSDGQIKLGRP